MPTHHSKDPRFDEEEMGEAQRVLLWRRESLEKAGISPELAEVLATSTSDLHEMLDALSAGCSEETLCQIYA